MSHTPEPWTVDEWVTEGELAILGPKGYRGEPDGQRIICAIKLIDEGAISIWGRDFFEAELAQDEGNARRIPAAVNACRGIPVEALEAGAVGLMWEALEAWERLLDTPLGLDEGGRELVEDGGAVDHATRLLRQALAAAHGGERDG